MATDSTRFVDGPSLRRTNERPGTRAILRNLRTSAYKVREVLDLIRGQDVRRALEILQFCDRGPAEPVAKLLNSAIANAVENDGQDRDELFVSACFADEGVTMKRFKPRARGRAGRIRKRSSHVTIIVDRLPEDRLERLRAERIEEQGSRRRRVAGSRAARVAGARKASEGDKQTEATQEADTAQDQVIEDKEEATASSVEEQSTSRPPDTESTDTDSSAAEASDEAPSKPENGEEK